MFCKWIYVQYKVDAFYTGIRCFCSNFITLCLECRYIHSHFCAPLAELYQCFFFSVPTAKQGMSRLYVHLHGSHTWPNAGEEF